MFKNGKTKLLLSIYLILPILAVVIPLIVFLSCQSKIAYTDATLIAYDRIDSATSNKLTLNANAKKDSNKSVLSTSSSGNLKDLMFGGKNVNSGNYIVFFGTAGSTNGPTFPDVVEGYTSEKFYPTFSFNRSLFSFFNKEYTSYNPIFQSEYRSEVYGLNKLKISDDSAFVSGINESLYFRNTQNWENKIRLSMNYYTYFIDYSKINYGTNVDRNSIKLQPKPCYVSPFYTWSSNDAHHNHFSVNNDFTTNEKWINSHTDGKYAINSSTASTYRNNIKDISNLFLDNSFFSGSENLQSSLVAVAWLNGKPTKGAVLTYSSSSTYTSLIDQWSSFLNDVYGQAQKI